MIAYCKSVFVRDNKPIWNIESYLANIDDKKWKSDFVETAHRIVNLAMAKVNIIPNVSSVLFRNPGKFELFECEKWKSLKMCGDWVFYLHLMRGGAIAYTTKSTNYYRQHENNVSAKLRYSDDYYKEHEYVALNVAELYSIPFNVFLEQQKILKDYWKLWRTKYSDEKFNSCYSLEKIKSYLSKRKPNILMVIFAFSTGGGPGYATTTWAFYLFRQFFDNGDIGYSCAMGVVLMIGLLLFSMLYLKLSAITEAS